MAEMEKAEAKIVTSNIGDIQPKYSNFVAVSHTPNEFIITFCLIDPAKIAKGGTPVVEAEAFSRIIVSPTLLPNLINALSTNLKTYNESVKKELEKT